MRRRVGSDDDIPELTARDFKRMRPAGDVHPALVESYKRSRGRPPKSQRKIAVTLRLDPDVVKALRASGPGWQTRTNTLLARWAKSQKSIRSSPKKRERKSA